MWNYRPRTIDILTLCIPILIFFLSCVLDDLSSFALSLLLSLGWLTLTGIVGWMSFADWRLRSQRPMRLSSLVVTVLSLFAFANYISMLRSINYLADGVKLYAMQPLYEKTLATLPHPRFYEWELGGMTFAGTAIIYDETDQIQLDPKMQKHDFQMRLKNTDLKCGNPENGFTAQHYWGHYYLSGVGC